MSEVTPIQLLQGHFIGYAQELPGSTASVLDVADKVALELFEFNGRAFTPPPPPPPQATRAACMSKLAV